MCPVKLKPKTIEDTIYRNTMIELRAKIECEYGSVRKFAAKYKFQQHNLYRCFGDTDPQEMSIGLFARINIALGNPIDSNLRASNLSLKQYLQIDNNAIFKAIFSLNFSNAKPQSN